MAALGIDDLQINVLENRRGEKWSHYEGGVIPAWVADMDFELALPIREAIIERVNRFDCGYPVGVRETGLPEIFAERVADKFDWQIEPAQVDLFNDVVQGIYFGLLAFSEEQEGVLVQTPIYPPFLSSVAETKRRVIECPLQAGKHQYEIDFDSLEMAIDKGTRVLLFCNPHNPTGRCFSKSELESLATLVLKHRLYVICDEIHADLILDDTPHIPLASLDREIAARTVTLMSASKAFNMAGICMAFAVYGGPEVEKLFSKVPRHLRGGLNALSVAGVSAAFTAGDSWLQSVVARLRSNRDLLHEHVASNWSQVSYLSTQATYLAWLDCRKLPIENSAYRFFLENAKVALSDGARFGNPGKGFARLNFATSEEILREILTRMDHAIDNHC